MRGTLAMPMLKPWMFGSDVVPLCKISEKHRQATCSMAALAAAAAVAASALATAASALAVAASAFAVAASAVAVAASAFAAAFSASRRS